MKIILEENAIMPTRAHKDDAGLDLYSREDKVIPAKGNAIFDTGVHVELPLLKINDTIFRTVGFLKSKSGLNVKYDITSDGVIDFGYTGSIVVKLYNNGNKDYHVSIGDKISQLVILPVCLPGVEVSEQIKSTDRGYNGFGSSGK